MNPAKESRGNSTPWSKVLFSGLLLFLFTTFLLVILAFHVFDRMDQFYYSIPENASRQEVRQLSPEFQEYPSSQEELEKEGVGDWKPRGYSEKSVRIFRYSYRGIAMFSAHIVYDENDKVIFKIPTWE